MKILNKKKKGQAILIVLVVSVLSLMILIAMANRVINSRINVERSAEFDNSVVLAENQVNKLIGMIDPVLISSNDCFREINLAVDRNFKEITCDKLKNSDVRIYARLSEGAGILVDNNSALTHYLSKDLNSGTNVSTVKVECIGNTSSSTKFLITRAFIQRSNGNTSYGVDKGIISCDDADKIVDLYYHNQSNGNMDSGNISKETIFVRAKPYAENQNSTSIKITTYYNGNKITQSGKYEFVVSGIAGLGNDSTISFELPIPDNSSISNPLFDYVYWGDS